jgi:hypothetical protein
MQYTLPKDDLSHFHVVAGAEGVVQLLVRRSAEDTLFPLSRIEDFEGCEGDDGPISA